jgi:signal transduction histidine kinase
LSNQVLIVEDERLVAQDISQILQDEGYEICAIASDGETAIKKMVEFTPDLALLDIRIKGNIDGVDVARFIQSFFDIPIIYLTAFSDAETLKRAQATNPMGYVVKPFRREQLLTSVKIALSTYTARKEKNDDSLLKHQFLSIMSHELRTPLNAILGFSQCLQSEVFGPINQAQVDALQTIDTSGNNLLMMINKIIDLSMIEAGKFKLNLKITSIASLGNTSISQIKKVAIAKKIEIETNMAADLPDLLLDQSRMLQVLEILLENALKFTLEKGRVTLEIKRSIPKEIDSENVNSKDIEKNLSIQISVIDTGIGIAPDDIDKLFQLFSQVDSSISRKYEGMGLGLAYVKAIAELHGGSVSVASKVGAGSRFTVDLPL